MSDREKDSDTTRWFSLFFQKTPSLYGGMFTTTTFNRVGSITVSKFTVRSCNSYCS